ncbi:MAG: DUF1592 domain-containing protein [Verrucomicrobiales bacterium]|nr:DUF1592 domain-containing protein [Verrucomicrobiales bacterium]
MNRSFLPLVTGALLAPAWCCLIAGPVAAADAPKSAIASPLPPNHPGKAIYEKLCLDCHGPQGEGVKDKADEALHGDRDIAWLTDRVHRTMPEEDPDLCVGEDARAVSEYMYHAFYSAEAQARLHPPRAIFSRLTESQFRHSVTDLVGAFRGGHARALKPERGLKGFYDGTFKRENDNDKPAEGAKFDRVEGPVRYDFGEGIPTMPEGKTFDPSQFTIRWEGSLIAEESGVYEIVLRTRNGAMLWVNNRGDEGRHLIDAYVAPHNDWREEKASIHLLAGRAYPVKLDYFKYKEKAGGIELWWKPPHGVLEPIPARCLSPEKLPESLVVSAPFPPDDRSTGYERGILVSKAWQEAVTSSALQTADYVVDRLDELAGTKKDDPERRKKVEDFARRFLELAYRRPLTDAERRQHVETVFQQARTPELAVKRLVLLAVASPRFLYPDLVDDGAPSPDYGIATRMALALWDSLPDKAMLESANKGELKDPKKVDYHTRKALESPRARAKMRGFYHEWLEMERGEDLAKDAKTYPGFDAAMLADLRTSLWLFLDEVTWGEKPDYRQLLLSDSLFLNDRLGAFYGRPTPGADFQRVAMDAKQRTGIITHPFLLATHAYHNNTSPIHRGVFLTRNIVGMTLKSPVEANQFDDSKFDPNLTMREKVTEMTRSRACMGCHQTINPLGFSLEHFDGVGRWRTEEKKKPIDPASPFTTGEGETIDLKGARDVAEYAANSPSAHRTFIRQLFQHLAKQPIEAYGPGELDAAREQFEKSGFHLRDLIARLAAVASRRPEGVVLTSRQ